MGSTLQFHQSSPLSLILILIQCPLDLWLTRMGDHIPSSDTERNPTHNLPLDTCPNHLTISNLKLAIVNFCSVTNKRPHLEVRIFSKQQY